MKGVTRNRDARKERIQEMGNSKTSRSWFCVFNHPEEHGFEDMEPQQVIEAMKDRWMRMRPDGACALTYCIAASGTPHVHAVFEAEQPVRFTAVQKAFPGMHIEPTKGSKAEAEDYINKVGKYEEKGEEVLCKAACGEIRGHQGKRKDWDAIDEMLAAGMKPEEIFAQSARYRRNTKEIREAHMAQLMSDQPYEKDMLVIYHVGKPGTGKSYSQIELKEKYPDDVYVMSDYSGGGLDRYNGERILFMDEFRGQLKFNDFLMMLDKYIVQHHARYSNPYGLWTEVHITSVLPPEEVYYKMVPNNRDRENDSFEQMLRRITIVRYHEQIDGEYYTYDKPADEYMMYEELIAEANSDWCNEWLSTFPQRRALK